MAERIQIVESERLTQLIKRNSNEFIELSIQDLLKSKHIKNYLMEETKASLVNNSKPMNKQNHLKRSYSDTFQACETHESNTPAPKVFVTNSDAFDYLIGIKVVKKLGELNESNSFQSQSNSTQSSSNRKPLTDIGNVLTHQNNINNQINQHHNNVDCFINNCASNDETCVQQPSLSQLELQQRVKFRKDLVKYAFDLTTVMFTEDELRSCHYPNSKNECASRLRRPFEEAKINRVKNAVAAYFEINNEYQLTEIWYSIRSELNKKISKKTEIKKTNKNKTYNKENSPVSISNDNNSHIVNIVFGIDSNVCNEDIDPKIPIIQLD